MSIALASLITLLAASCFADQLHRPALANVLFCLSALPGAYWLAECVK